MAENGFIVPQYSNKQIMDNLTKEDIAKGMVMLGYTTYKYAIAFLEKENSKKEK